MNTNKESWEREFGIRFISKELGLNEPVVHCKPEDIKQFIKTQRTQAKEEERKRIEEGVKQLPVYDYTHSFVHGSGTKALQLFERVQTNKTAEVLKIINKTNEDTKTNSNL